MAKNIEENSYEDEEFFRQYDRKAVPWWIWVIVVALPIVFIITLVNFLEVRRTAGTLEGVRDEFASMQEKVDVLDNSLTELWKLIPSTNTTKPSTPTDPTTPVEKYTTVNLNLRSGPGSTFDRIAVMARGSKVIVLEEGLEWFKVRFTDPENKTWEGYANKQFLADSP